MQTFEQTLSGNTLMTSPTFHSLFPSTDPFRYENKFLDVTKPQSQKPHLVIQGHRGGFKPDNSMQSFIKAKQNGLEAIELDVSIGWSKYYLYLAILLLRISLLIFNKIFNSISVISKQYPI